MYLSFFFFLLLFFFHSKIKISKYKKKIFIYNTKMVVAFFQIYQLVEKNMMNSEIS